MMREIKRERRLSGETKLLAMGNPAWKRDAAGQLKSVLRSEELLPLPRAETEVRRIGQLYGKQDTHVYIGAEARESRFKAEAMGASVVHLATHGVLSDASPLYSYVLLAGEDGTAEDGLLEAWELMRMNLKAELVVLSACESARGRIGAGEGVIGMSWALVVAGVPTTILSQWKVDSDSTSDLMVNFHANRRKGMSDSEAMRAAALKLRNGPHTSHPFFWAPFIVIGAGMN